MKYKVAELEGTLLDAVVAKGEGRFPYFGPSRVDPPNPDSDACWRDSSNWPIRQPSSDWLDGGTIIEREGISLELVPGIGWSAGIGVAAMQSESASRGSSPLVAAMRAYAASKFGEEAELP